MSELFVYHTMWMAKAGEIGARGLANVANGAAHIGRAELFGLLFETLARAAEQRVSEFKHQELANTAWAFATVSHRDEKLFAALA